MKVHERRHQRTPLTIAIRVAAGLIAAAPAFTQEQVVNLADLGVAHPGFRIDGMDAGDLSGQSVSGAGDVNGDGLEDVIIGALGGDPGGEPDAGESYVVFGKADATTVDLATLGAGGFRIDGIDAGDRSGVSVSGAGDVNGDGLDDVIIGAYRAAPGGELDAGESYVVFGKADAAAVDLATLGAGGFRIDGIDADDHSGRSVSGPGDVNGDGLDDLIIGAESADAGGTLFAGESYVVFGKADTTTVDLATLGAGGFRIDGIDFGDKSGRHVSGAGDVNGDGLDDLIIGAFGGNSYAGESYVVFGKADSTAVDLAALGPDGFRIDGIDANDRSGFSVSGAGDVNGDGLDDLIIGAATADAGDNISAGESYVVFGKPDTNPVDLANLGTGGFRIDGIDADDRSGRSVSGAGDVNGDGLADLIIGAYHAGTGSDFEAGESYVVFGKADSTTVDLATLGAGGFRIDGIDNQDHSGFSVSGAGDVNSDGLSDLIIGAPSADPAGDEAAGESYVVFGREFITTTSIPLPPDLSVGDSLGGAVATDGNLFVVGLPNADVGATDSGRVVVYRAEGGLLVEDEVIDVPDTHFATNFGAALALEGDQLVVGAPGTDPTQAKGGLAALQAAIFGRLNDGSWAIKETLSPMNGNAGDEFGASVAIAGPTIAVGAPGDADGVDSGAAYVFEFTDDLVQQMRKLKPEGGNSGAAFGASVAAARGRIAVGAPGSMINSVLSGSVTVFEQVSDNLMDLADRGTMTGSQSAAGDSFGRSVALTADTLVVGAPGEDGSGTDQGAAYLYDPQDLIERTRIVPDTPQDNAGFGRAVSANARSVAVGAPGLDAGAGAAFEFDPANGEQRSVTRAQPGQQALGQAVALGDDSLIIGAPASSSNAGAAVARRDKPVLIFRTDFE